MKRLVQFAFVVMAYAGLCAPAHAIVFDFFWSSDPLLDANIISSDNDGLTVTGTMEINVAPGASFGLSDISNVNLSVSSAVINDFAFTAWTDAAGSVAADGLTATFVGAGSNEPFVNLGNPFFGCRTTGCIPIGGVANISVRSGSPTLFDVLYTSADAALASMQLTAQVTPVPLPAALPLFAGGLGMLGLLGWRRKRSAA